MPEQVRIALIKIRDTQNFSPTLATPHCLQNFDFQKLINFKAFVFQTPNIRKINHKYWLSNILRTISVKN